MSSFLSFAVDLLSRDLELCGISLGVTTVCKSVLSRSSAKKQHKRNCSRWIIFNQVLLKILFVGRVLMLIVHCSIISTTAEPTKNVSFFTKTDLLTCLAYHFTLKVYWIYWKFNINKFIYFVLEKLSYFRCCCLEWLKTITTMESSSWVLGTRKSWKIFKLC